MLALCLMLIFYAMFKQLSVLKYFLMSFEYILAIISICYSIEL